MSRILILGGTGALGHKLYQLLREEFPDTRCTIRGRLSDSAIWRIGLFHSGGVIEQFDAMDERCVEGWLRQLQPEIIINCIGVIKQRTTTHDMITSLKLNSLLPHLLADMCRPWGGRLIHFSTDCVFAGTRGGYREEDLPDATDIYGRTKFLGETSPGEGLTLRTSFIGRELFHHHSLLDWFLSQNHGSAKGYTRAMYSGLTSIELSRVVSTVIRKHGELSGVYHVAGNTISKFELLKLIKEAFKLDIEVTPDADFRCDRSILGERFVRDTGYTCPDWPELVAQLASDPTPYTQWREAAQ